MPIVGWILPTRRSYESPSEKVSAKYSPSTRGTSQFTGFTAGSVPQSSLKLKLPSEFAARKVKKKKRTQPSLLRAGSRFGRRRRGKGNEDRPAQHATNRALISNEGLRPVFRQSHKRVKMS